VKDVALAHIRALEIEEAANHRFILSTEQNTQYVELARSLEQALASNGYDYSIRTLSLPRWMVRFGAVFSSELENILFLIDEPARTYNNQKSRQILGIGYERDLKSIMLAAAESLI